MTDYLGESGRKVPSLPTDGGNVYNSDTKAGEDIAMYDEPRGSSGGKVPVPAPSDGDWGNSEKLQMASNQFGSEFAEKASDTAAVKTPEIAPGPKLA